MKKIFIISCIVVVICLGLLVSVYRTQGTLSLSNSSSSSPDTILLSNAVDEQNSVVGASDDVYVDTKKGFSFSYPRVYQVTTYPHDTVSDASVVTLRGVGGVEDVQVMITPIDGEVVSITKERLMADIPDLGIRDEYVYEVGSSSQALVFLSDNPDFGGDSYEAWFAHKRYLYQISGYTGSSRRIQSILSSWQFLK